MLRHHSSRRTQLDQAVLQDRLQGAVSYDRIAGYFRSSLFEIAGEALRGVSGKIRIVCNADCDPKDLETAAAAQAALRRSWCRGRPEEAPPEALPRYQALYAALVSEKIVVPFGSNAKYKYSSCIQMRQFPTMNTGTNIVSVM